MCVSCITMFIWLPNSGILYNVSVYLYILPCLYGYQIQVYYTMCLYICTSYCITMFI